jgi:riboflavin-specific deaminase-like protein
VSANGGEAARAGDEELLRGLLPAAPAASAADTVAALGLWDRPRDPQAQTRPRVLLNMVSSADGRATLEGRSAGLSSPADRALFHALRAASDAVLVGAGTVRAERYGPLIRDGAVRELRRERGLAEQPLACIVSSSMSLDPEIPLLADPAMRVVLLTPSPEELPPCSAEVSYVRCDAGGRLDLTTALAQLHERFGVRLLLCEGGPHLAWDLVAAGVLDELFLSLSPTLVGGEGGAGRELRILAGMDLRPPVQLELVGVLQGPSQLFLRYEVVAPEWVSRATMESSSLAR